MTIFIVKFQFHRVMKILTFININQTLKLKENSTIILEETNCIIICELQVILIHKSHCVVIIKKSDLETLVSCSVALTSSLT